MRDYNVTEHVEERLQCNKIIQSRDYNVTKYMEERLQGNRAHGREITRSKVSGGPCSTIRLMTSEMPFVPSSPAHRAGLMLC